MEQGTHVSVGVSFVLGLVFFVAPQVSFAAPLASAFEVSGWIPYWRTATGTADTLPHLSQLTEINPFVYTIKSDGSLRDNGPMKDPAWVNIVAQARAQKVRVIPTVMTGSGDLVDELLRDPKKRIAHINHIQQMVRVNGFDGVDINYEGKYAKTRPYFSQFLKELAQTFPDKWIMCTIESRTPNEDRFVTVPEDLEFANDFKEINTYCDRVRIMAYDQMTIDLNLNKKYNDIPYAPVADPAWVEKTIRLAIKDINPRKIMLGIPTYGYEWEVTAYADGYTYEKLWSFNPGYAWPIAQAYGVTPQRNVAGELSFSYVPTTTPSGDPNVSLVPNGANVAAAAQALAASNNTNHSFNVMWWSDGEAIRQKVDLAKKLGIRGVAVFKFDGGEDQGMWNFLKEE